MSVLFNDSDEAASSSFEVLHPFSFKAARMCLTLDKTFILSPRLLGWCSFLPCLLWG